MVASPGLPFHEHERPRTPSPTRPFNSSPKRPSGLGLNYESPSIHTHYDYDIRNGLSDSPTKSPQYPRFIPSSSTLLPPDSPRKSAAGLSPNGNTFYTPRIAEESSNSSIFDSTSASSTFPPNTGLMNPFNFTPTDYASTTTPAKPKPGAIEALGRRKGHKYRHSSMHTTAMDSLIKTPILRPPLAVPTSLPIPTRKEIWRSLTSSQRVKATCAVAHLAAAGYVQYLGMGSLAITALSRLMLFDAMGAFVRVLVDLMANFEVWKRCSLRHPFGLQRADVLAGFGLAVLGGFMGLDVLSHGAEHSLENLGHHEAHVVHSHSHVTTSNVHIICGIAVGCTSISALLLRPKEQRHNTAALGTTNRAASTFATLTSGLNNPAQLLTLTAACLLMLLPLLEGKTYTIYDTLLSILIATCMLSQGLKMGTSLANILLMSYRPPSSTHTSNPDSSVTDVADVLVEISAENSVLEVTEARFWQPCLGICLAGLKLRVGRALSSAELMGLRERVAGVVCAKLAGREGVGWEVSVGFVGGEVSGQCHSP